MQKISILALFMFLIIHVYGQTNRSQYISGEGHFTSEEGDGLNFIRNQLLASAFKNILSKELKTLGFDADLFWLRYDQKFNQFFEPTKTKLEERYGVEKRKELKKALRIKRKTLQRNYANIHRAIGQYSIKKTSRSPRFPKAHTISVQAKVNRNILHRIYLDFTTETKESNFQTLYLSVDFQLENMSWNEMGTDIESSFTSAILERWKKEIIEYAKSQNLQIQNVVITDEATFSTLNAYMQTASETLSAQYPSSLWAKLHFTVTRTEEDTLFQKREYKIQGDLALIDLSGQKIVLYQAFSPVRKSYNTASIGQLSGQLSGFIYNMPLNTLKKFPQTLKTLPPPKSKVLLSIAPYRNIGDVLTLMKALGEKGIAHQFSPKLENYSQTGVNVSLKFLGDLKKVKAVLLSLNNRHISPHLSVKIYNPQNPLKMALEYIDTEQTNSIESTKSNKR